MIHLCVLWAVGREADRATAGEIFPHSASTRSRASNPPRPGRQPSAAAKELSLRGLTAAPHSGSIPLFPGVVCWFPVVCGGFVWPGPVRGGFAFVSSAVRGGFFLPRSLALAPQLALWEIPLWSNFKKKINAVCAKDPFYIFN